ncbi:MAG: HAMP domain-containing sensor histidine kinase [Rhizobiaceae bacterium]|nr:HAMP domain-containing sensor histidine kinase [Rhizobiaceae bacterium]
MAQGGGTEQKKEQQPEVNHFDGVKRGLSVKLLLLTIIFIMIAEILIFVPSMANFRNTWLRTHLDNAEAASIVYLDIANERLSDDAAMKLLETAQANTIAFRLEGRSQLLATSGTLTEIVEHIDLANATPFSSITSAMGMLYMPSDAQYRVFDATRSIGGEIELVQEMKYIQAALWKYARNILFLSLLISVFAAALVYLALYRLIVLPIIRISSNMDAFSKEPENAALIYQPSGRGDEIGVAESRLTFLQTDLRKTLKQKQHLADLGLAVAKINHDLRNILASAQLFSDRLTSLPDPTVQRFAPKLIRTIDRAVDYTKSVIDYGKAVEAPPERRNLLLRSVAEDVREALGLDQGSEIRWQANIDDMLEINGDPEQVFRVLMNLCRNAHQAMRDMHDEDREHLLCVSAEQSDEGTAIRVKDTGPGIPEHIQPKLFNAFQASTKAGGTGLGMTIAAELVRAHGGTIDIEKTDADGTIFKIFMPHNGAE